MLSTSVYGVRSVARVLSNEANRRRVQYELICPDVSALTGRVLASGCAQKPAGCLVWTDPRACEVLYAIREILMSDMLSVMIIGASGRVGGAACAELQKRHRVITAGRQSGDIRIDITDPDSIERAFVEAGSLDAVIVASGRVQFSPLDRHQPSKLDDSAHAVGIHDKLLGQVNVAYSARDQLNANGSITLTSGISNVEPTPGSISPSLVNGALDAFVTAAALEMPRGIRLNAVSPTVLTNSLEEYGHFFRGMRPVDSSDVGLAYARCVESRIRGWVVRAGW